MILCNFSLLYALKNTEILFVTPFNPNRSNVSGLILLSISRLNKANKQAETYLWQVHKQRKNIYDKI